jgi:Flp pilus assembly protein TadG
MPASLWASWNFWDRRLLPQGIRSASLATAEYRSFWDDESGVTYLEFAVGMMTFVISFGIIEFSHIFYQWIPAAKAVRFGARLAPVSQPVPSVLASIMTGEELNATGS